MKTPPDIQDSIELRFSELARKMNARGVKIISLGLGEPGFPTPPEVISAAHQAMLDGMTRYSNPFGLMSLRDRIARKLNEENNIDAETDEILVAPGAKMALSLVLSAILHPGDEIINVTPCYPSYIPQVKIAEPSAIVRNVDLTKSNLQLDIDSIGEALNENTRAILINFPHNPTGRMLDSNVLDRLIGLIKDHHCFLISDEIYERLAFGNVAHVSPGSRPELEGRVITINGFSKAFSMTGWRVGYLHVSNKEVMQVISRLQQHINTNTAPFSQIAALTALNLSADFLESYNTSLRNNNDMLYQLAKASPNLEFSPGEGGLFAFLDISATGKTSDQFATELLESYTVALIPGIAFGENWDDHVRISLAIDSETFNKGMSGLGEYVGTLRAA